MNDNEMTDKTNAFQHGLRLLCDRSRATAIGTIAKDVLNGDTLKEFRELESISFLNLVNMHRDLLNQLKTAHEDIENLKVQGG